MRNNRGFTLVELIVVAAIFIVVILISTYAFEKIIRANAQQSKGASTQIEGMVGLEMLRTDLGHAGFALPWSLHVPRGAFTEVSTNPVGVPQGITASSFNEAIPRAIISAPTTPRPTDTSATGPDYLVLKSALLALDSTTTGRWGFANYAMTGAVNTSTIGTTNDPTIDLQGNVDRVITIRSDFSSTGTQTKELMMVNAADFSYTVPGNYSLTGVSSAYQPTDSTDTLIVYGISDRTLAMPYNRADYYIDFSAAKPASCNPLTGILYKGVAGQSGSYTGTNGSLIYPLLNCVGDMRVVYHLDMNDDGNPGTYTGTNGNSLSSSEGAVQTDVYSPAGNGTLQNPASLRQRLKDATVYILAHEGQKDLNYIYPAATILVGDRTTGVGATRTLSDFGADWMNYRWKVYKIPVSLKNLD